MIYIPFPFFMVIPFIPTLIILDLIKKHRVNYIRKFAGKLSITKLVEITFELRV